MADAKLHGPFTRILVATRGAPWSERALELGVRMATAYQLELVVIAVLTPIYVPQKNAAWGIGAALEVGVGCPTTRPARAGAGVGSGESAWAQIRL